VPDNNRGLTSDSSPWRPWPAIPASGRSRSRPWNDPNAHVRSNAEEILRERDRAKQRSPRALQRMPAEGRGQWGGARFLRPCPEGRRGTPRVAEV